MVLHHKMKQKPVIFLCPDIQAIIVGKEPFLKVSGLNVFFAAGKNTNSVKELNQIQKLVPGVVPWQNVSNAHVKAKTLSQAAGSHGIPHPHP